MLALLSVVALLLLSSVVVLVSSFTVSDSCPGPVGENDKKESFTEEALGETGDCVGDDCKPGGGTVVGAGAEDKPASDLGEELVGEAKEELADVSV